MDMFTKAGQRLKSRPQGELAICDYRPALKKYFRSLNEEWLRIHFEIEDEDRKLLNDPHGEIIKKGGAILFACVDKEIVGTCALLRTPGGCLELGKMAVTAKFQGLGIGGRLLQAAIDRARAMGAEALLLQTSTKLLAAIHLYEKYGFHRDTASALHSTQYKRKTFVMKLTL